MEANLQKQNLTMTQIVYNGCVEQPVECEVSLPEYCPDVQRVLCCQAESYLRCPAVQGEKLLAEGTLAVTVFYRSDQNQLKKVEYKLPYTRVIEMKSAPENALVYCRSWCSYLGCRAVSPRRLDLKSSVTICALVRGQTQESILDGGASGGGLQLKCRVIPSNQLAMTAFRQFDLAEEVELEPGKAPAEEIIAYRLTPQLTEQKVLGSRLVLKGELAGHVLYRTQGEGGLAVTDFVLPLSQIIDLEGLSEEDECQVYLSAQGSEVRLESGGEGESGRLMVDGVISVMIRVHRREEAQVVEDSFSTLYPSEEKTAQITLPSLVSQLDCSRTCRFVVPVPSQMTQVLEAWCRLGGVSVEQTEEGLSVVLRFGITLIGLEEDGSLTMADRSEECRELVLPGAAGQLQAEPEAWITASSFSMQPTGEAEVRCEVRLAGPVYENSTYQVVSDIRLDTEKERDLPAGRVYLYYACPGEEVWEIAKRYQTPVQSVVEENQLTAPALGQKTLLMIPVVK